MKYRAALYIAMFLLIIMTFTAATAQTGQYDLLLKGGHVIDPANRVDGTMDVAVSNGVIASVAPDIPAGSAKQTLDVSGYYVTPGFVDLHVHVFHTFKGVAGSVIADHHCFPSGVTTCVDAGTSGADNFEDFKEIIDNSRVRILAFLNISRTGMNEGENEPPNFNVRLAAETAKRYPGTIVGFKTAHYWRLWKGDHAEPRPYDKVHTPWASVDSLVAAGILAGLPVMVDFDAFPPQGDWPAKSYRELILEKLRPGDIHTHCYARHFTVIGKDGRVNPDILKARKRGVRFDVGHGGASIIFRNAIPAIEQRYLPDTISTDLHAGNVNGPVVNLITVMSKFVNMGMTLNDVVRRVTVNPAHVISRDDLGTLSIGTVADIAVFSMIEGDFSFVDSNASRMHADKKLESVLTVFGGDVVYDPFGLTYTYWKEIPKNDPFWRNPSGQTW